MPRVISALAIRQLQAWEVIAKNWPVYTSEYGFIRCAHCDLTVWRIEDDHGQAYSITDAEILSLRVAHLRNHHPSLDPTKDITLWKCRRNKRNSLPRLSSYAR